MSTTSKEEDAVPVVAHHVYRDGMGYYLYWPHESDPNYFDHFDQHERLVRQRDHLSAIAALQAQIAELQARQVPAGWIIDIEGDTARVVTPPDGPGFITVAQSYGRLEQRILFALAKALAAPSNPTTQPPEGR